MPCLPGTPCLLFQGSCFFSIDSERRDSLPKTYNQQHKLNPIIATINTLKNQSKYRKLLQQGSINRQHKTLKYENIPNSFIFYIHSIKKINFHDIRIWFQEPKKSLKYNCIKKPINKKVTEKKNTLEGGEKMEPKIPEEESESLEPNNWFVNEEDEPVGFRPSISLFLWNEPLSRWERERWI